MLKALIIRIQPLLPVAAAMLTLYGCTAAAPADPGIQKLPVETLWAANQSNHATSQPLALWVTDSDQLTALARSNPVRAAAAILGQRQVDWRREGVVWLYMGQKTSGGYALSLGAPQAHISHGTAVITVHWREPSPGAIVTQQLTSPCLVLKLPRGNYGEIAIQDESGRLRARAAVKNDK